MARRKKQDDLSINPFKADMAEVEALRRKLAKRANQRLVRAERARISQGEVASDLAPYQYAYERIVSLFGQKEGKKLRFREQHVPMSDAQSRAELYALQNFLAQPGSSLRTLKREISKTQKTFEARGITVSSYKSFYNFLNSQAFRDLKELIGDSNQIVELFNRAHEEGGLSFKRINQIIDDYLAEQERIQREKGSVTAGAKSLAKSLGLKLLKGGKKK